MSHLILSNVLSLSLSLPIIPNHVPCMRIQMSPIFPSYLQVYRKILQAWPVRFAKHSCKYANGLQWIVCKQGLQPCSWPEDHMCFGCVHLALLAKNLGQNHFTTNKHQCTSAMKPPKCRPKVTWLSLVTSDINFAKWHLDHLLMKHSNTRHTYTQNRHNI